MSVLLKKALAVISLLISSLMFVTPVFAAAPDGNGPWADSVFSVSQGLMKNGLPVPGARSNPNAALGVAENDSAIDSHFFSLGFGGKLALGFDNGISSGVIVVEATNPNYPVEKAKVEVSENGVNWVLAGTVIQDGSVNKPAGVSCAKYVRITDISTPADYPDDIADGYDVDGVKATGEPCKPPTSDCGCCNGNVAIDNRAVIINSVNSVTNTGGNVLNGHTASGSANITTGNAHTNIVINNNVNNNNVGGNGCCNCNCNGGNHDLTISHNGSGSSNTINDNKPNFYKPAQLLAKKFVTQFRRH